MSIVVLDAGVYIANVLPETLSGEAKGLIAQLQAARTVFHAPTLIRFEMVAVARKAVYQKRVTPQEGLTARDVFLNFPITLHFDEVLLKRAYELATTYNRPTAYDAQYLALAERLNCDFWTADERLFNAVSSQLPTIKWLGNWQIPPTT